MSDSENDASSIKEEGELNKYFFELEKQIITLDTLMIAFLSSDTAGLLGISPPPSILLRLAFIFFIGSIGFSLSAMYVISKTGQGGRTRFSNWNISISSWLSLATFFLGLVSVFLSVFNIV